MQSHSLTCPLPAELQLGKKSIPFPNIYESLSVVWNYFLLEYVVLNLISCFHTVIFHTISLHWTTPRETFVVKEKCKFLPFLFSSVYFYHFQIWCSFVLFWSANDAFTLYSTEICSRALQQGTTCKHLCIFLKSPSSC